MTRPRTAARQVPRPAVPPSAHVCSPGPAVTVLLARGARSSVTVACSTCATVRIWISDRLGKVIALPPRGES